MSELERLRDRLSAMLDEVTAAGPPLDCVDVALELALESIRETQEWLAATALPAAG